MTIYCVYPPPTTHTHTVLSLTVTKGDVIPESATTARTCITFSNQIARDVEVEISTLIGVPDNSSTPAAVGIGERWNNYSQTKGVENERGHATVCVKL